MVHISHRSATGIYFIFESRYRKSPLLPRACKIFSARWYAYSWSRAGKKWGSFDPGVPCNEDGQISVTQEYAKEYFSFELFYIFDDIWHGRDAEVMNGGPCLFFWKCVLCFSKYRHLSGNFGRFKTRRRDIFFFIFLFLNIKINEKGSYRMNNLKIVKIKLL